MISCAVRPVSDLNKRVILHAGGDDMLVIHRLGATHRTSATELLNISKKELSKVLIWYVDSWHRIEVLERWQPHNGWSTILSQHICTVA